MTIAEVFALASGGVRGLRVAEYDVLVDAGLLDDEPVELLEGALVATSPQRPARAEAVSRVLRALTGQVPTGWGVRSQMPLVAGDRSEPEPDIAVVVDEDYSHHHPAAALLVVEVSRSSRAMDLGVKPRIYAAGRVAEYWVLDLPSQSLHAHRQPGPDGYAEVVVHEGGTVTTAGEPRVSMDVDQVMPSR